MSIDNDGEAISAPVDPDAGKSVSPVVDGSVGLSSDSVENSDRPLAPAAAEASIDEADQSSSVIDDIALPPPPPPALNIVAAGAIVGDSLADIISRLSTLEYVLKSVLYHVF